MHLLSRASAVPPFRPRPPALRLRPRMAATRRRAARCGVRALARKERRARTLLEAGAERPGRSCSGSQSPWQRPSAVPPAASKPPPVHTAWVPTRHRRAPPPTSRCRTPRPHARRAPRRAQRRARLWPPAAARVSHQPHLPCLARVGSKRRDGRCCLLQRSATGWLTVASLWRRLARACALGAAWRARGARLRWRCTPAPRAARGRQPAAAPSEKRWRAARDEGRRDVADGCERPTPHRVNAAADAVNPLPLRGEPRRCRHVAAALHRGVKWRR